MEDEISSLEDTLAEVKASLENRKRALENQENFQVQYVEQGVLNRAAKHIIVG